MNRLGEGAILATNNKKYYQKVWSIRDCGKNIEKVKVVKKTGKPSKKTVNVASRHK